MGLSNWDFQVDDVLFELFESPYKGKEYANKIGCPTNCDGLSPNSGKAHVNFGSLLIGGSRVNVLLYTDDLEQRIKRPIPASSGCFETSNPSSNAWPNFESHDQCLACWKVPGAQVLKITHQFQRTSRPRV